MSNQHFSVTQFFHDGTHETVRRGVEDTAAIAAFAHYTGNVASRMGLVTRVIVTDADDCICLEWEYGKGITFPPQS